MSEWNVPNGEMIEKFVEHMDMMLDHMNESYRECMDRGEDRHGTRARMCSEYHASLHYYMGNKYVKVCTNESVCAFVVACTNDKKFQYGDILKPAGWITPARNFARGNIFDSEGERFARVRWTGAL